MVCEEKRSSKLIPVARWLSLPLSATEFRHTQNIGSSMSACKAMCKEMHFTLKLIQNEWIHCCVEDLQFALAHCDLVTTLICILIWFSRLLCFLLLYETASSNSDPQEALRFLIICTSNRGHHRDADHKFSPPPAFHCGAIALQQLSLIGAVGSNC